MYRIILPLTSVQIKKVPVFDVNGNIVGEVTLPLLFNYPVRNDVIRRAFLSAFTARLQPKGRDPLAGKRRVGESWGIHHGLARVPRLDNARAVLAPMTRGGRLAHPPKVEKRIYEEVNKKERVMAIISALSATSEIDLIRKRGHVVKVNNVPIIVNDEFENISLTSEVRKSLISLGLWDDVVRAQEGVKIRAGRGKMRGRRYKTPKSFLAILSSNDVPAVRSLRNLPGVDVVSPNTLSILHLAPGGVPGRLTLITVKALDLLSKKYEVVVP